MLFALLGLHAVLALAAPLLARRLGRGALLACAIAPAASVAWVIAVAPRVLAGPPLTLSLPWAPSVGLTLDLRLDAFALLMVVLVSGVGVLVFCYAAAYFSPRPDLGRFAAVLTAFAGAMLGLVLADNLLLVYVFWEATSITSYLLIGFDDVKGSARAAALQAFLVTAGGGLAMLAGFVLLARAAGTYSLSGLLAAPPAGAAATVGVLLVLLGAFTKSAQVPFHAWLPGAMAAPTPVSAYLHSATMVKAGVYLIARLAPAFALVALWRPLVVGVGVATMIWGGVRALRQNDLKLLLAFGTVSQLGFLTALLGAGAAEATLAGAALLLAHGAFKATLFMVTGVIDHQTGTRDLRLLSGVGRRMPLLAGVAALAAASMAGLPPLFGFVAKEAAFEAFLHGELGALGWIALAGVVLGSALTVAYSLRYIVGAFGDRAVPGGRAVGRDAPRPAVAFVAPAAVLALAGVVLGLAPKLASPVVTLAAAALDPALDAEPLKLWHGLTPALALSVVAIAAGAGVWRAAPVTASLAARLGGWPGADAAYAASLRALNGTADRVTGALQNGSLPVYLAVILVTVVALPLPSLLAALPLPEITPADSPVQPLVCAGVVAAAIATVAVRRRFTAVLCLGAVGYGVAVLFVLQGAPDLALTQLLIETLAVVIFVLVLRHLPAEFEPRSWRLGTAARRFVAAGVGAFVFVFALVAGGARKTSPISEEFLRLALPEADGRNVVNVILVDFRGFDTLGEITVLAVAALGIAGLVRSVRADREHAPDLDPDPGEADGAETGGAVALSELPDERVEQV